MANFFTKLFGSHSSHELKKIYPIADKVDALEEQFAQLKAMFDTLGVGGPAVEPDGDADDDGVDDSIEALLED